MPDEIASDAHAGQVTPAHVLAVINQEIVPRLKAVESTANQSYQIANLSYQILKAAGILNGKGDELVQIVKDFRRNEAQAQAWDVVRADISRRFRWLRPGKHWLALLLAGILGAAGWQIVAAITRTHLPPPL